MPNQFKIDRRAVLKGMAGVALPLPLLEVMGREVSEETPRRLCALYIANGMALPDKKLGIDDWSWFPRLEEAGEFVFGKSTDPLEPYRKQLSFLGGLQHDNGPRNDPHVCSDMWLTGAPLHDPAPVTYTQLKLPTIYSV